MKVPTIMIVFFILFGLVGISYVQYSVAQQNEKLPQVLLQLQIRNSEGQLVSYVEGTKIVKIQHDPLNEYLDKKPNKRTIVKEGKSYDLIQWQARTEKFDRVHVMAMFNLWIQKDGKNFSPLLIRHGGYQVEPGDTLTIYWTITRPIS